MAGEARTEPGLPELVAELELNAGAEGLIVSNQGGRVEESLIAPIDVLMEVVRVVRGRVPILVDSGFRRGTDVFKALALGASAVCVGRPYALRTSLWPPTQQLRPSPAPLRRPPLLVSAQPVRSATGVVLRR